MYLLPRTLGHGVMSTICNVSSANPCCSAPGVGQFLPLFTSTIVIHNLLKQVYQCIVWVDSYDVFRTAANMTQTAEPDVLIG